MTDTNTAPENGASPAAQLGERLRSLRIRHNLSLSDVSDRLQIRSHVLSDMENGNFSHLKEGECLAYARYMGIDLAEVRAILAQSKSHAADDENSRMRLIRTGVGIGALAVIAVGLALLIASGGSGSKPEAEQALVAEPGAGSTDSQEGEELNLTEIKKNSTAANLPEPPKAEDPLPVSPSDESLSLSGSDPEEGGSVLLPEETPLEIIPESPVESGVITFDEELKAAGNIPDGPSMLPDPDRRTAGREKAGDTARKDNAAGKNPNAGYGMRKPEIVNNTAAPSHTRPDTAKKNDAKKQGTSGAPATAPASRKPLKAGEVRSLADEMGLKKTPAAGKGTAPAKQQVQNSKPDPKAPAKAAPAQKAVPANQKTGPRNLNGVKPAAPTPAAKPGKQPALKAGEVRSLASEGAKSAAKPAPAAANVKVRQVSGNGRVYDPEEVRRKADQVMKN